MQTLLQCNLESGSISLVNLDRGLEYGLEYDEVSEGLTGHRTHRELTHSQLLDAIQTRVEKMAAYFGRRCGVDEDDLRQEAWVAVLEMLPRLDHSVGIPEQHLLKRARWRILDTIRRQRRRQHVALDDVPPNMTSYLDTRNGIDISALFARLTVAQQRILRALMEGYTWREVGTIVGCTSANVAYHVRRIRAVYSELNSDVEV